MKIPLNYINPTGGTHTGTVIFFHGSADTGPHLIEWVRFLLGRDLEFPHLKIIYPTAPLQPYTPLNGSEANVWFDRRAITIDAKESRKSLANIYKTVHEIISEEEKAGIPLNRIIVGGFSMGGALAIHTGYHLNTDLAGVFACSSFLNKDSIVYDSLRHRANPNNELPELRMFHGENDTLIPLDWGEQTFKNLKDLGVNGEFFSIPNTLHELKKHELINIRDWILTKLPMSRNDIQHKL